VPTSLGLILTTIPTERRQTAIRVAPGPIAVSIAALGIRPQLQRLNIHDGVVAAAGVLLMGAGGILIGTSISTDPNDMDVLPGWMIVPFDRV